MGCIQGLQIIVMLTKFRRRDTRTSAQHRQSDCTSPWPMCILQLHLVSQYKVAQAGCQRIPRPMPPATVVSHAQVGGCKAGSAAVTGAGVYGRLKFEAGIHRVQRVPVTEKGGRVHTSAAAVAVLPQADEV